MVNREHTLCLQVAYEVDCRTPICAFLEGTLCASTLLRIIPPLPDYSHKVKYMSTTYCTEYIMSNEQRYVPLHSVVPALGLVIEKYQLQ